jgi:photosystem II stability/assembly factor-like uncharacterized protein
MLECETGGKIMHEWNAGTDTYIVDSKGNIVRRDHQGKEWAEGNKAIGKEILRLVKKTERI